MGKSIATVRRLEGSGLHPRRDANGVHRFDHIEVENVASRYAALSGSVHRPNRLSRFSERLRCGGRMNDGKVEQEPAGEERSVTKEVSNSVERERLLEERIKVLERQAAVPKVRQSLRPSGDVRIGIGEIVELIDAVNELSDRELRHLPGEFFQDLDALLARFYA